MRKVASHFLLFLFFSFFAVPAVSQKSGIQAVKVGVERLPDLNTARSGHLQYVVDGEMLVVGGHTSGFVPTLTAEYFAGGQWHQIPTCYAHDYALGLQLRSGKVLIAGGCDQSLGIGQTFGVERYLPSEHRFEGFGCLTRKRTLAGGVELDDGQVYISGNWYDNDDLERFDGANNFEPVKGVSQSRTSPYMLQTAAGEGMILSALDTHSQLVDAAQADRLTGSPFQIELLRTWKPVPLQPIQLEQAFIGDREKGYYAYLLAVADTLQTGSCPEQEGLPRCKMAIALIEGEDISLLPTVHPIPQQTRIGGVIRWASGIVADTSRGKAYLSGYDKDKRLYLFCVDYKERPAPVTLFFTDPLPQCGFASPMLMPDGQLVIAGGNVQENFTGDNYALFSTVFRILVDEHPARSQALPYLWRTLGLLLAAFLLVGIVLLRRLRRSRSAAKGAAAPLDSDAAATAEKDSELMEDICRLMDEEQLFLNPNLKIQDLAKGLNTNTRYISEAVNTYRRCSFNVFVNRYRIAYAQRLMNENPEMKIATHYMEVGFSSERSFFRTFRQMTGMTPNEWMARKK